MILPKEFRFNSKEVNVTKIGDVILLTKKEDKWFNFKKALNMFTKDFMEDGR